MHCTRRRPRPSSRACRPSGIAAPALRGRRGRVGWGHRAGPPAEAGAMPGADLDRLAVSLTGRRTTPPSRLIASASAGRQTSVTSRPADGRAWFRAASRNRPQGSGFVVVMAGVPLREIEQRIAKRSKPDQPLAKVGVAEAAEPSRFCEAASYFRMRWPKRIGRTPPPRGGARRSGPFLVLPHRSTTVLAEARYAEEKLAQRAAKLCGWPLTSRCLRFRRCWRGSLGRAGSRPAARAARTGRTFS